MNSLIARSSNRAPGSRFRRRPADELDLVTGGRRRHAVDPEAKLAGAVELAIDLNHILRDPGVVDAGQSRREYRLLRRQDVPLQVLGAGRWNDPVDQPHGPVDQDSGRLAGRVVEDLTAGRGRGVLGDVGPAESLRVGPSRVPVHPLEPDRPVRRDRVEHGRGREGTARPEALVPASTGDPGVAGCRRDPGLHSPCDLIERADAAKINLLQAGPQRFHVSVRVDQSRHREVGGPIDDGGSRSPEPLDVLPAAHRDDRAVSRGDRLGPGIRGVAGPDPPGDEDEIGRTVRSAIVGLDQAASTSRRVSPWVFPRRSWPDR